MPWRLSFLAGTAVRPTLRATPFNHGDKTMKRAGRPPLTGRFTSRRGLETWLRTTKRHDPRISVDELSDFAGVSNYVVYTVLGDYNAKAA